MTLTFLRSSVLFFAALALQAAPPPVPHSSVITAIDFKEIPQEKQKVILERIGVRVGDTLTAEVRQRIGRELGKIRKGMTFTYKPGKEPGTATLIIAADC